MTDLTERNVLQDDEATLNVTWAGQNGNLSDPVPYESSDAELKAWATEAVRNGDIAGVNADESVDLSDFIVDRYRATTDKPFNSLFLRPKTPFGHI